MNARISGMLQYILCVSRFSHYMKVIARDKLGAFQTPADCQDYLHRWISNYIISDDKASYQQKAAYPLRDAQIEVRENPGKPGSYLCTAHFRPHFQLDALLTSVRLTTELVAGEGSS